MALAGLQDAAAGLEDAGEGDATQRGPAAAGLSPVPEQTKGKGKGKKGTKVGGPGSVSDAHE